MTTADLRAALPGLLTLDEAVALIGDRASLQIDVKGTGFEEPLIAAIRRDGLESSALVSCTDPRVLRALHRVCPTLRLGLSTGHIATGAPTGLGKHTAAGLLRDLTPLPLLAAARWCGATEVMIHHRLIAPTMVQAMHDAGLRVYAWTVDRPETMRRIAPLRIDGLISNVPDVARETVGAGVR